MLPYRLASLGFWRYQKAWSGSKSPPIFPSWIQSTPPKATPLLHHHYSDFFATTNCSVPVSCFGTFIFEFSVSCISPLTSTRLVPTVPYQSLYQNHASYTPDTTCSVTECLASSSWSYFTPPSFDVFLTFRRVIRGSFAFVFLILT